MTIRGQGKAERSALSAVSVGPNPAAMRLDDRLADCQAHSAALFFRSKERFKYLFGLLRGQPQILCHLQRSRSGKPVTQVL
jgi:hypothetical protein